MHLDALAAQVMRALRGRRSQTAFSRRLGYRTNVAYAWEAGRRAPTAAELLRAAARVGVDVRGAVQAFLYRAAPALDALAPTSPAFAAAVLRELRGATPMRALAARVGLSTSAVSRVLAGTTQPRVPLFFRLIEACSRRLLDLLARIVDVRALPAARDEWRRLEALRALAGANPLAEAVPRFLELDAYARRPHRPGWIAARLGVSRADEDRTLAALAEAGVIRWDGARWAIDRDRSVDTTRLDPQAAVGLRAHWTDAAATRIRAGADGQFSYLVFTTDDATLAAIRELHLRYFREMRALVAASPRSARVAVANIQLFAIDGGAIAAPRASRDSD